MEPVILVINPGSTSTRSSLYRGAELIAEEHLICAPADLEKCEKIIDQAQFRTQSIVDFLDKNNKSVADLDAIAARGGPLRPIPGGVYAVNQQMLEDAQSENFVEHVSKLACVIADNLAKQANIPAFIADAVSTDEYAPISRISGLKELPRKSLTHALNMKHVSREYAKTIGKSYESLNLITAHLGGGISIAVHNQGKMVDSVDANGDGPFSPERAGLLRSSDLAKFVAQKGLTTAETRKMLTKQGGVFSHTGSTDVKEMIDKAQAGDEHCDLIANALAYNIAKSISSLAVAVNGQLDGIILTGGIANSPILTKWIADRVKFLAPVEIIAGQMEMEALRDAAIRVLADQEKPRVYPTGEFIN